MQPMAVTSPQVECRVGRFLFMGLMGLMGLMGIIYNKKNIYDYERESMECDG